MTTYTSPPDQFNLVLNSGDTLNVGFYAYGVSYDTTINDGGVEDLYGGESYDTTINDGGVENVYGRALFTVINNGGVENVEAGGLAIRTVINNGGVENVTAAGRADGVIFGGPQATLELATPSGLIGFIRDWHVGDVIDFLNTVVTSVHKTGDLLMVTYPIPDVFGNQTASYVLAGQQANTEFKLQSDGHGGTDLILTPIIGVHPLHEAGHLL